MNPPWRTAPKTLPPSIRYGIFCSLQTVSKKKNTKAKDKKGKVVDAVIEEEK